MKYALLVCLCLLASHAQAAETAESVEEWLASNLAGVPKVLAAGVHVVSEPIVLEGVHSLVLEGPARALMDPMGWGRAWWAANQQRACIICFDLPAGVPGIKMIGCRAITLRGVNLCRATPGCLITDSNAAGRNSGEHLFQRCGFYHRTRAPDAAVSDPLAGLGMGDNTGHYGLGVYGTNGCDNYTFEDCEFSRLDRAIDLDCPQTTRMIFVRTHWRYCNLMGLFKRSGNITCVSCARYAGGPLKLVDCPGALTSVAWIGGWLDTNRREADGVGLQPLVDFSQNPSGRLLVAGGNGRKLGNLTEGVVSPPLVVPPENPAKLTLEIQGALPYLQPLLPE